MAVPSPSHDTEQRSGLSENTEHLLIAAAAIVATVMITFAIYVFYRIRKGSCLSHIFRVPRKRVNATKQDDFSAQIFSLDSPVYLLDREKLYLDHEVAVLTGTLPIDPQPAPGSLVKEQPESTPANRASNSREIPYPRPVTPVNTPRSFLDDSSPPARTQPSHNRETRSPPKPPALPLRTSKPQRVTRYSDGQSASSLSASIPTFIYGARDSAPKLSRFSWTTTQSTQAQHDTRFSVVTSVGSLPRHRTVESWVNQQTGRIEEREIWEHLQERSGREPVPDMPKQFKHNTMSDASVFRQHPGTEVVIPRGVLIPSAVLNSKVVKSAL